MRQTRRQINIYIYTVVCRLLKLTGQIRPICSIALPGCAPWCCLLILIFKKLRCPIGGLLGDMYICYCAVVVVVFFFRFFFFSASYC